ncbi:MAG: phosphodiester glycosidase family protein [Acidobacteriota bacterium]
MRTFCRSIGAVLLGCLTACASQSASSWLGTAEAVAPGVVFYRAADESLVDGAGPIAVFLLKIDPADAHVAVALSNDEVVDAESVVDIAARRGALAAVNGGYFNANGEPLGLLKVAGELVSDSTASKGVVIVNNPPGAHQIFTFDQLAAKMTLTFTADGHAWSVPIDGVDTTRERGRLMLYTPAYHADTDTAPTGTEWVLDGQPMRVTAMRPGVGRSRIPRHGAVLSYGGTTLPPALTALTEDVEVTMTTGWRSARGLPVDTFESAADIVAGAGLLRHAGVVLSDWKAEGLAGDAFTAGRHPRTLIGVDTHGQVWLAAVDGRLPTYSVGMTFADLQRLADRLQLTDALNLDGGGSTTMVVKGQVVNKPSDPAGARPVGDALIVTGRGRVE